MTTEQRGELLVEWRRITSALVHNRNDLSAALVGGRREEADRIMRAQSALAERMLKTAHRLGAPDELTAPLMVLLEADEVTRH